MSHISKTARARLDNREQRSAFAAFDYTTTTQVCTYTAPTWHILFKRILRVCSTCTNAYAQHTNVRIHIHISFLGCAMRALAFSSAQRKLNRTRKIGRCVPPAGAPSAPVCDLSDVGMLHVRNTHICMYHTCAHRIHTYALAESASV